MSCMIMSPESTAAIANATAMLLNRGFSYFGFEATAHMYEAFGDCRSCSHYVAEEIYKKLYTVNVTAYNNRYENHEPTTDDTVPDIDCSQYTIHQPLAYANWHCTIRPWHYHLAKLIDFWCYQTNEHNTWKDPIRVAMLDFQKELSHFIVYQSDEYFNAPEWGKL